MSSLRPLILALVCVLSLAGTAMADGFNALARVDGAGSLLEDTGGGTILTLDLSQPVPWRVFTLDAPRRLVLDFREAAFDGAITDRSAVAGNIRTGTIGPGWSRLVLDLDAPLTIETAGLATDPAAGRSILEVRLSPVSEAAFAEASGAPEQALFAAPPRPEPVKRDEGRILVVLDPGHGGIDPGAEVAGIREADLMLTFARELREEFLRTGVVDVAMTRTEDVFVPLETRVSMARAVGADVFLSLHADALAIGNGSASGATIYTLSDEASDMASQLLAERHDASDLLAGMDLSGQGDEVALILMDLARQETAPRSDRLAASLVEGITARAGRMNHRPLRSAGFSVLKAPDIPSVLIELGFLSSERDRKKLVDAEWRAMAARGIREAVLTWAEADAALAELRAR